MKKTILSFIFLFCLAASAKLNAQALPSTYVQTNVITGLNYSVDWDWTPDGRYFVSTKGGYGACTSGKVLVYSSAGVLLSTFCDVTDSLTCDGEKGLLGIAVDPNFAANHFVYTYYVCSYGAINAIRVMRWTENANVGTNPVAILTLNLNALGFSIQNFHYSGIIRFRPSQPNQLYVEVGEMYHLQSTTTQGSGPNFNLGQQLSVPYGKILRINTDGTIPTDNPFYDDGNVAIGNDDRIWSYGHRNMFGMCVNPVTDSLYEAENGYNTWDEFNIIHKGGNYGWNVCEGNYANGSTTVPCSLTGDVRPLTTWATPLPAITGCLFYSGTVMPEFNNHILVADNDYGRLYDLTMGNSPAFDIVTNKVTFADVTTTGGLTTIRQGADGCIYAMKGGYTTAGTIFKICHASGVGIAVNDQTENSIGQNYPNPTNGKTQIDYAISQNAAVNIDLYDITGRKVKNIFNAADVQPGKYTATINDMSAYANGSYFYKIEVKQGNKVVYTETKRLLLVK